MSPLKRQFSFNLGPRSELSNMTQHDFYCLFRCVPERSVTPRIRDAVESSGRCPYLTVIITYQLNDNKRRTAQNRHCGTRSSRVRHGERNSSATAGFQKFLLQLALPAAPPLGPLHLLAYSILMHLGAQKNSNTA